MIDWNRIYELKNDILCEDFAEVFALFLEEVEGVLARLRDAPDPHAFEEDFHFLKGSAVNVGFSEFADVCFAAERAAARGEALTIDVKQVLDAYSRSLGAFMDRAEEFGVAA